MVDDSLKHAHANRSVFRALAKTLKENIGRSQRRATKGCQSATRNGKPRKLLHEFHGSNEHGNVQLGALLLELVKKRRKLRHPTLPQKEAHRLKPRVNGSFDNLGALGDKYPLFRLQHTAQLALR